MSQELKADNIDFNSKKNADINKTYNKKGDMICYTKTEFNYKEFYELFGLYLSKMPNNLMTKQVGNLYTRKGIFAGMRLIKSNIYPYSRLIIRDKKLNGIILDTQQLDVKLNGETDNIDNCVYSTYFSMIRAAIICNEEKILGDYDFHALVISYFYYTVLKAFGQVHVLNKQQLDGILLACGYLYLRYHLGMNHSAAKNRVYKIFDKIDKDTLKLYSPKFELLTKYKQIKDIGKVLIDLEIISEDPNRILIKLIQLFGKTHFYNLMGPLSYVVGSIILSNYPSDLFEKNVIINNKLQSKIENETLTYLSKTSFEIHKMKISIWG